MSNSDGTNMWKVIQDLNGTPDANAPSKAMSHDGRTMTNIKSKLTSSQIITPGLANSICHNPIVTSIEKSRNVSAHHLLTMKAVLHFKWVNYYLPSKKMKVKGGVGPDNISSSFLKPLGSFILQEFFSY